MDISKKEDSSRRDFIKKAAAGMLGTAIGGVALLGNSNAKTKSSETVSRIAFGSCANQAKPQPIWDVILNNNPDLFLFLGDNIYADTKDMSILQKKYKMLAEKPGYQRLLNRCPVLSTWDDHDYGENDAGVDYPKKKESENIFLDFFDIPQNSPRRQRPGIYGSYMYGSAGKRVQIILLDTRYFKDTSGRKKNTASDEMKKKKNIVGIYLPTDDTSATLLGEDQWIWLEEQLKKEADLRIIGSSIQVVSYEKGMESWGNYPHERDRLFTLIEKTKANGVLFISGDVHFSELSMTEEGPYPLYDFTASGLTHSNPSWSQAVNNFRIGNAYAGHNAGMVLIDWQPKSPLIELQTLTVDGDIINQSTIKQSELHL